MKISFEKVFDGNELTVKLNGRLDTVTSPKFKEELSSDIPNVQKLILDFTDLEYISSAGLRVLLVIMKELEDHDGKMVIRNANAIVVEIFLISGFSDFFTME